MKFPQDKISSEEAEKIHNLATSITFKVSECGPIQLQSVDGKKIEHSRIAGFQALKARDTIEEMIWNFLLRGY